MNNHIIINSPTFLTMKAHLNPERKLVAITEKLTSIFKVKPSETTIEGFAKKKKEQIYES